ncbi:MAG: hypothetical protein ACRERE_32015 [Candidatus Entotheonellia bacterium]
MVLRSPARPIKVAFESSGQRRSSRMLAVILAPTEAVGVYYPITARPADRKERRNYEQVQGRL